MLAILLCVVAILGVFALMTGICEGLEKLEEYVRFKIRWSIGHLNYKPKRYGARDYCKPMGF